ncbi:PREDICTED: IgGFc-binding protein-like [Branchiostoma belcheri]|uniref:IgGFc-binding protein-like n=1 Tax=Branchiostoma belcheri TaxID=7741 RepID=A0A6P4XE11_BRABE|nr:PREDICTED: IgGFc-binding protein-like [Branchiostoma belcheri]
MASSSATLRLTFVLLLLMLIVDFRAEVAKVVEKVEVEVAIIPVATATVAMATAMEAMVNIATEAIIILVNMAATVILANTVTAAIILANTVIAATGHHLKRVDELNSGARNLTIYNDTNKTSADVFFSFTSAGGYKGCYVDQRNRVFPHAQTSSNSMTTAVCVAHCRKNGYAYAGTQYASQCFCGTAAEFARLRSSGGCNKRCKGNSKEICGGTWRMSVYVISGGGGGGGGGGGRTHYRVYNEAKTYTEAQKRCEQNGGSLADLKTAEIAALVGRMVDSSKNYWIGLNDLYHEGRWHWSDGVPLDSCSYRNWYPGEPNNLGNEDCAHLWAGRGGKWNDLACSSKQYFICQTGDRVTTGCTGSPVSKPEYKGCYRDAPTRRFPNAYESSSQQSTARCVSHCKSRGFSYAGTQYSHQCFCGTDQNFQNIVRFKVPDSYCNKVCRGNPSEKCGGTWLLSVYKIAGGPKGPGPVNSLCLGQLTCPKVGMCQAWGDPHYITFDNRRHDFQGTCKYVLVRHADFTVAVRNVHRPGKSQRVAFCDHVEVTVYGFKIEIRSGSGREVLVNGRRRNLPACLNRKVAISISGLNVQVQTDHCFTLTYDGNHRVQITVPESYKGKLSGMCGNYNGRPNDDNLMPTGQVASTSLLFGNSWIAPDDRTCPDTRPQDNFGPGDISSGDRGTYLHPTKCGLLKASNGPFRSCNALLPPTEYVDTCVFDLAAFRGEQVVLCQNLQAYADACVSAGGKPQPWRRPGFCAVPCPANSRYSACASPCPRTCADPGPRPCTKNCVESCVCDTGYVLSGARCVPLSSCGCVKDGNLYEKNEVWTSGNERCTCLPNKNIKCERVTEPPPVNPVCLGNLRCPGRPGQCKAWGDPHYITFDNRRHDFQGTCKYVLVRHADFTVAVRNVHRPGKSQRVSFCDHVEVNVHNYEIQIRSGTGKEVLVNGYRRSLPACLGRKVAISVSGKHVLIQTDQCLSVLYDGRHSVIVRLPTAYKSKVSGMCGNYNGRPNDDNLMPTGQVASTSLLFGNSWIAPDDETCPDTRPQDNFDSNDITAGDRKLYGRPDKCGLLQQRNGPFGACSSVLNPSTYFESCVFDMAAYRGDEDMLCENLEAYSDDCTAAGGKPGRWRTANRCPMPCPEHSSYNPCGSACPLTCAEPNPRPCVRICVESCVCDQGYVLSGSVCVPRSSCGCSSNGNYYQKNEVWRTGNKICKCTNSRITCEAEPSSSWDTCPGSLSFVTIGWSGVWGVNSRGVVFYRVGTAGKEGHFGREWKQIDGNLAQISSGKGIVWGVNSRGKIYVRIGITEKVSHGKDWRLVTGQPLRSVCVSSSSNFVWGVSTTGTVWRRTGITTGNLIGITAQRPQGTAWRLVGGSLTQIYVSSSSNRVWGCGLSHHIYLRVGITWSSGPVDVPEPTCHSKADIHVLVDGSKSVQQRNFPSVRQFILKLAAGFEIGPGKARIGVYQFAKDMQTEFKMNQYNNRAALLGAIRKIEYMNKLWTRTGQSLKAVYNEFTKANGARDDAEKIIILVTDGKATDQVREPAQYVKNKGAHVFTVGVAKYKLSELQLIASNNDYVATADDFEDLDRIRDKVLEVVCNAKTYSEAQRKCEQNGGSLADLKTAEISAVVVKTVDSSKNYWIGLNDLGHEGRWHWSDGVPLDSCSFKNWYPGEPNNVGNEDCAHLWAGRGGKWNDLACNSKQYFICQTVSLKPEYKDC